MNLRKLAKFLYFFLLFVKVRKALSDCLGTLKSGIRVYPDTKFGCNIYIYTINGHKI